MRRFTWLLAVAFVFGMLRPVFAAPMFPDVPDMWAKDAVAALAAKGILEGYPDGTFKGDRAATRYEVAMIVARLLAKMEQEHATFATRADLDELRNLVNQLRQELDALGVRVQNLEDNVSRLDKRVTDLERITFYGSLDARFVSNRFGNTGLSTGLNGSLTGGAGGTSTVTPLAGGNAATAFNTGVGIPVAFVSSGGVNPLTGQSGFTTAGRPLIVRELAFNTTNTGVGARDGVGSTGVGGVSLSQSDAAAVQGVRGNYNSLVGGAGSLGGSASPGVPLGGGSLFTPLTGRIGVTFNAPVVLPMITVRTGRPLTNGVGWSGEGILGVRIKLNEDMDAGAEFAAFYTSGDSIVDAFYGVSANHLGNAFAGVPALGATGGIIPGVGGGQSLDNTPFTRMNLDNFWFVYKPTGVKVQIGAFGDTDMDSIVYQPEYNPNLWGPRYLDNYGFRVSGSNEVPFGRADWEIFGSDVADGNRPAPEFLAAGGSPYHPYMFGFDLKWNLGHEGNGGYIKGDAMRIWEDSALGSSAAVGGISNVNGVWTNWVNPPGFYSAQLSGPTVPGAAVNPPQAAFVAGIGSTSDIRPIIPTAGGNPGVFGTDQAVGTLGNATGVINPAVIASGNGQASTFGPQSQFTWGVSGGWGYTFSDNAKVRLEGEYSNSHYKPSGNSRYVAPSGNAWRVSLGATIFRDFDVDGEYVNVDPFHNPFILQYPQIGGLTYDYTRIPSLSWFPEMYPTDDKDVYPNNREGFRVFVKWNPVDPKDGKRKTVFWGEYGDLQQERSSLQDIRFSPGSLALGNPPGNLALTVPNGFVLGYSPGFIDTVFQGFSPSSFAGFTGATTPSPVNQFATPLENPLGRVTNWGVGVNYRFDQLNGLAIHAGYKNYWFNRPTSLAPQFGGSENNVNLNLDGGLVGLQYPINDRFALKGGYSWTNVRGHYDPTGLFRNFALDTGSVGFQTFNTEQTAPFVGFDYDLARNVNWNMTAEILDSKDRLGTFNSPNFFLQRNPFSWGGVQVTSQLKVSF